VPVSSAAGQAGGQGGCSQAGRRGGRRGRGKWLAATASPSSPIRACSQARDPAEPGGCAAAADPFWARAQGVGWWLRCSSSRSPLSDRRIVVTLASWVARSAGMVPAGATMAAEGGGVRGQAPQGPSSCHAKRSAHRAAPARRPPWCACALGRGWQADLRSRCWQPPAPGTRIASGWTARAASSGAGPAGGEGGGHDSGLDSEGAGGGAERAGSFQWGPAGGDTTARACTGNQHSSRQGPGPGPRPAPRPGRGRGGHGAVVLQPPIRVRWC